MKPLSRLLLLLAIPFYFSCNTGPEKNDWKFQVCDRIARSDLQQAAERLEGFKGTPRRATDSVFGTYLSEVTVNDTIVNEYLFSQGQVKRVNTTAEGTAASIRLDYDGKGNIISLERLPEGQKNEFTYDGSGRPESHVYTAGNDTPPEKTIYKYFPGNDSLYIYHEGRGVEKLYLTETDTVVAVLRNFEDKGGLLLSQKSEYYDRKVRIVEINYFRQTKLYLRTRYEYDHRGNVTFRLSEREAAAESEKLLAERASSYRFEYHYDQQGNWTQKVSRQLDGNWMSTETRKIEY
ncbi:hypothetical protein MKQ68_12490 [Chitinophaga horti]|uniref:YD repeat-containing protein n=1 Tax=Chitinophaga horti TaxID=2920382 RepID=A0ABY6JCI1_9BACT|nr:hypothetical protein [Chitinophaga horti]UYQ95919.1 hypothetical protein MKQ68_12490 [Chitinophaga horti]